MEKRIEEVFKSKPEVTDKYVHDVKLLKGDIAIKDLTFYYQKSKYPALKNISKYKKKGKLLGNCRMYWK